jgi:hypothetical protein
MREQQYKIISFMSGIKEIDNTVRSKADPGQSKKTCRWVLRQVCWQNMKHAFHAVRKEKRLHRIRPEKWGLPNQALTS